MKIIIETIPHKLQRYPTVGDWFVDKDGTLRIHVSEMKDWRHEMLIAVHELVEVILCRNYGVSQEDVDKFDMNFEANRKPDDESEPGDNVDAPYSQYHCFATGVERALCSALNVSWKHYDSEVMSL
jgi:hypothetical protein